MRNKIPEIDAAKGERKDRIVRAVKDVGRIIPFFNLLFAGYEIAQLASATNLKPPEMVMRRIEEVADPEEVSKIVERIDSSEDPFSEMANAALDLLNKRLLDLEKALEITLEPGDSTVQVFNLKTNRSVLFKPANYRLHMQVEYSNDGKDHYDAIDFKFSVK